MLVLSRKIQEKLQIGSNITVTILKIKGGSVRIGIDAPDEVKVMRTEILGREKRAAQTTPAPSSANSPQAVRSVHRLRNAAPPSRSPMTGYVRRRLHGSAADSTLPVRERGPLALTTVDDCACSQRMPLVR